MKVAIPGATGLIGRLLVKHLIERGHEPVVLTRNPSRVSGDLADLEIRRGDPDSVVNLAGEPVESGRRNSEFTRSQGRGL
jgi:uncharacterized protein